MTARHRVVIVGGGLGALAASSALRRAPLDATVVDLAAFLPNVSEMLRRSLRGDIEIRTSAPAHPYRIRIDPT